jgi:uncharacterized protein HemX
VRTIDALKNYTILLLAVLVLGLGVYAYMQRTGGDTAGIDQAVRDISAARSELQQVTVDLREIRKAITDSRAELAEIRSELGQGRATITSDQQLIGEGQRIVESIQKRSK